MDDQAKKLLDKLTVTLYELNLLLKRARSFGIRVVVDTVDKDDHTEISVTHRDDS